MTDKEHLATLTKGEIKYLSKFGCLWCDHSLAKAGCSGMYDNPCTDEVRIARRKKCLENYKPRKRKF
jgi:hypothetical protein